MKKLLLAAVALGAALTASANAATVTVNGDTTGGPTFNRPLANGNSPPTSLSGVGTAVHYQVTPFTVGTSGSYTFLMTGTNPPAWDTYLGLYQNSFNPAAPLTNALIYNDDNPSIGLSGFTLNLNAGTSYFALATGFANSDFGAYTLRIDGPGAINVAGVPEPSAWALMLGGFALAGLGIRRRSKRSVWATA